MPNDESWVLLHLNVPEAEWQLPRVVARARIMIESGLSISVNSEEPNNYIVEMMTEINLMVSENSEEVSIGRIKLTSQAIFSYSIPLDEMKLQPKLFNSFVTESAAILSGINRTEIRRIASMAGLNPPILIPTQYLEKLHEKLDRSVEPD